MNFKILSPPGYQVKNILNENIDINVVFENGDVFFATLFTVQNIQTLMVRDKTPYFWATDMIIVEDLDKDTIKKAVGCAIADGYLDSAFTKIGTIEKVYPHGSTYEKLKGI